MQLFKINTPKPHSHVISIYVLIVLIGFSSLLLIWSYKSGIQALDNEVKDNFEQRRTISEIILEHQMTLVDLALKEILESQDLVDAVFRKDKNKAQILLLSAIDKNTSFILDIGFLSLTDTDVWVDASSSFYNFAPVFTELKSVQIPVKGMIHATDAPDSLTLVIKSMPVVHPDSGKVLGRITGGFVLNNHLEFMEQVQDKTHSKLVLLFSDGNLISANTSRKDPIVAELTKAYADGLKPGHHFSVQGIIAGLQPLHINDSHCPLEFIMAISDNAYQELKRNYQIKTLAMFALAMIFSLLSVWVIRRLTTPSIDRLLNYSENITSGDVQAKYKPGMLIELNQVGHSMETMVESLAQANQELVYLRNYLSNIIDSMPSILVGIDTTGRVTQWNREAEKNTGISRSQALNTGLKQTLPRLSDEMDRIELAIHQRRPQTLHKRPFHIESETFYEDITIYPLTANGAEGAVIRIDDVTDAVLMEERMVQSEKMMSVGGLAAGMAHEINNPLAGMVQTADTLNKRLTTIDLPANVKAAENLGLSMETLKEFMEARKIPQMLEGIRTSGLRAADIVSNMLSFARKADSGMLPNNLTDLMDETLLLAESDYDLKKKYDFKQVKVTKKYESDIPPVPCEPGKIQQVFLNILINGAQAMYDFKETSGKDYTPEFIISITQDSKMNHAVIEIEDNGPGMNEQIRKRIFEPFFTTKSQGEGTGLGLSVSYFIVKENHNGSISVSSSLGSGAKFIIKLPIKQSGSLTQPTDD